MSQSFKIDWFDGTVDTRPSTSTVEHEPSSSGSQIKKEYENKPIGFMKLNEISHLEPPILNFELEKRPGFWLLFSSNLSDDFIVLIIRTLKTLYKCLDKKDSPKLLELLEKKFMQSDFFNKLYDYVKKLPDVRLSQKSRNSQLWNDANCFYCDLLEFYKGVFKFYTDRKEYLEQLSKVVNITDVSAVGVEENHSENISSSFHKNILKLQEDLNEKLTYFSQETNQSTNISTKLSNLKVSSAKKEILNSDDGEKHYQDLSIVPDFSHSSALESVNNIKPNIIDGAYVSVEHYLDIQFKLLREDCYRTIKEGICHYREHKTLSNCKDVNIRVYRKVCVTDIKLEMNRLGYVVDLSLSPDLKAYSGDKAFMHGSLLIFTADNFNSVLCATVITSKNDKTLLVEFSDSLPMDVFWYDYLMVESEVYFEPYHKVLKVLKQATPPIPMQKHIVYLDKQILPPAYLQVNSAYTHKDRTFRVLYPEWPSAEYFGLDDSQMEAYKFALTKEFVVIQGPPGTGKTFLGTSIAGTLLKNVSFKRAPMLIICATNHALDQFLEGLLKYTRAIVRLGGQSKSEKLESYNFKHLPQPKTFSKVYWTKKKEMDAIFAALKTVALEIEVCNKGVLSYGTLTKYYRMDPRAFPDCSELLSTFLEPPCDSVFVQWLLGTTCVAAEQFGTIRVAYWESTFLSELKKLKAQGPQLGGFIPDPGYSYEARVWAMEATIAAAREMLAWRHRYSCIDNPQKFPKESREARWQLYFRTAQSVQRCLLSDKVKLYELYMRHRREMEELRDTTDCVKLAGTDVVGMTTTMAAARHGLLRQLRSFVVIVEEAAEVLEAHIVAALTNECKHLILIGDHQQLRPNSAHYVIGKQYNLEVSLFERMVKNGVHSKTLTIQRRMRQEIRDLLVPSIYEKLDCHPSVLTYPNIKGMAKNLYFFDHNNYEEVEGTSSSFMNKFEAEWCVSLATYFVALKYKPSEITILATYSAQVGLIIKLRKNYSTIKEVHVTTVDNYQGEENRIVILSLVRSNAEKNVGFLGTPNRVCVALSRAKEGLYIFGNMSCLETSKMWRTIKRKLQAQDAIGNQFDLIIGKDKYEVGTTTELDNFVKHYRPTVRQ